MNFPVVQTVHMFFNLALRLSRPTVNGATFECPSNSLLAISLQVPKPRM